MWHVTVATAGRWAWFKETQGLNQAIRAVARVGGERLMLFAVGDDHAHFVLHGERRAVSQRAGDVVRALSAVPGCGALQPCHFKEVQGRAHLENLLTYLVAQPAHHGHAAADWPGTCLSDLVGARFLPGYSIAPLAAELPRRHLATAALRAAGLPFPLRPADEASSKQFRLRRFGRRCGRRFCRSAETSACRSIALRARFRSKAG